MGVAKTLALLTGVPVLLLLLLALMLLAELFPAPVLPTDDSSMLAGVRGGRDGGGLHGGVACGSGVLPLLAAWLGDLRMIRVI